MRIFTSISLVILLALNLFGFYISFIIHRADVREKMTAVIKNELLETEDVLSFSKQGFSQIKWVRIGKEFELNGKLYDVAKIETGLNEVKLYVEDDTGEVSLIKDFVAILDTKTDKEQSNSPLKVLLEHFLKEFTSQNISLLFKPASALIELVQPSDAGLLSCVVERHSPPPKLA